jgi:hypothetical protein
VRCGAARRGAQNEESGEMLVKKCVLRRSTHDCNGMCMGRVGFYLHWSLFNCIKHSSQEIQLIKKSIKCNANENGYGKVISDSIYKKKMTRNYHKTGAVRRGARRAKWREWWDAREKMWTPKEYARLQWHVYGQSRILFTLKFI